MQTKRFKEQEKNEIRNEFWWKIWQEYKNQFTMEEMAEIFDISLATFWRGVKNFEIINTKKHRIPQIKHLSEIRDYF